MNVYIYRRSKCVLIRNATSSHLHELRASIHPILFKTVLIRR